jgi:hypothetical protein
VNALESIPDATITTVAGGFARYHPAANALGRVGPGRAWKWLGNYYTPEALVHDTAVKLNLENGERWAMAHLHAFGKLPAAVMSYFRARFAPGPLDLQVPSVRRRA